MKALWLVVVLAACGSSDNSRHIQDAPQIAVDAAGSGSGCVPTGPEVCDGIDNDCNGLVDDVDVGGDGIYDCQNVMILGRPGLNGTANFTAWLNGNGTTVTRLADPATVLTPDLLAPYSIIVIDYIQRAYTADEATALQMWVQNGGGLMALSGYTGNASDYDNPNSLVAPMGAKFVIGLLSSDVTTFDTHPLTSNLTLLDYQGGFPVEIDNAATTTEIAHVNATTIASASTYGAGRVYLWGDEWVTFDSVWQGYPDAPKFWVDAFGWLGKFR